VSADAHSPSHVGEPSSFGTGAGAAGVAPADDKPELVVGAAFAGGVVAALILKRLRS
jgi:hypothetical protein